MPATRKRKPVTQSKNQRIQPAKTSFEFSSVTKYQAYYRQWNRCACCGQTLSFQQGIAHHVIPPQINNRNTSADAATFFHAADNCVILCENCHDNASFKAGKNAATAPAIYPYSHGLERLAHQQWTHKLDTEGPDVQSGT